MNSYELINKLYKPYRITKLSNVTILDSMEGKFVLKEKGKKDIKKLYSYLKSREFYNYPEIIDDTRSELNIFEYIDGADYPSDEKAHDMIKLVAKLHSKTSFLKEVTEDKFKEIYDNIKNNLLYYKDEYKRYVSEFEEEIFMSPSHYLFIRNSSKLLNQIVFCENELDKWYDRVKKERATKVSLIHNNLSLDHYIRGEKEALISWDNATYDSPILDIVNFYKKEALNLEFSGLLKTYMKHYDLDENEKELLFIMMCMPSDITFKDNEFENCEVLSKILDYTFKTEELVRPYYTSDNEEKK